MRVLTTGGAGYIGSTVVPRLLGRGHKVRVLDSLMYDPRSLLGVWSHPNFDFVRTDIRDRAVVQRALEGMDAVVHLAAIVGDPACARQPDVARAVNLKASVDLIEMAAQRGISRFVFASTCSNYGKMADPSKYVDEQSELRPVSLYAETKVETERALLDNNLRMAGTVLRFATIFGLSPRMRFDLTVNEFAMELLTKGQLVVYGDQFWRPYVHVRDAARAIEMVLAAPEDRVRGEVFNVGDTSQNFQKQQLVEMACAQLDDPLDIRRVEKAEDPRDYRVAFDKIRDRLDFRITRSVEDGIREVIDAIRQGVISDFDNPRYHN